MTQTGYIQKIVSDLGFGTGRPYWLLNKRRGNSKFLCCMTSRQKFEQKVQDLLFGQVVA